jgi:hypothetical protein
MSASVGSAATMAAMLTLAACAPGARTAPIAAAPEAAAETITVAVGPCFGFCPVYVASVAPDGQVRFTGERHTAVLGERTRNIGVTAYGALARDLAIFRPATGTEASVECTAAVSDTSSYTVTWVDTTGRRSATTVQSGCPGGPGHTLVMILRDLPVRLGIADWARQTTRPGASRG